MKSFTVLILLTVIFCSNNLQAQGVGVNNNGASPDASAMLDVSSTAKGFLPPRMTAAERVGISLPANGLIIYQTDAVTGLYVNKGTTTVPDWRLIGPVATVASPSFFFGTDASIGSGNYLGLGSSSPSFIRNTIVIPVDCVLNSIVLTRRGIPNQNISATVWVQSPGGMPLATSLSATIPSLSFTSSGNGAVAVHAGDLISIQITSSGSLSEGIAVSVSYQ